MYMGVKNHHILPRVACYEDAVRALAIWQEKPRRGKQVTQVISHADSIAFRLYDTDVVEWYSDNSVGIDNYGTVTTSGFAQQFLPAGIHLHHPVERRNGASGGANTIGFSGRSEDGKTVRAICRGDVVKFHETNDGRWAPDVDTCDDITLPVGLDRVMARDMARMFHLSEFETWLAMAPMHLRDSSDPVEHHSWDLTSCMSALEKREWRQAAEHMPLIEDKGAFGNEIKPLAILTARRNEYVTMRSLAKLKLAMWEEHGLIKTDKRKVWDRRDYDRGMKRVREMRALGLSASGLGPS